MNTLYHTSNTSKLPQEKKKKKTKMPKGKLYAISDIHVGFPANKTAWSMLKPHPGDGLILCGDVGDTTEQLRQAFKKATECFDIVWWCPGNHELYTLPHESDSGIRGEKKYKECIKIATEYKIHNPEEEEYIIWEGEGGPAIIAPIFTLYDYSFRPKEIPLEKAVEWAREKDTEATDEYLLHSDPYPNRMEWCNTLIHKFENKLQSIRDRFPFLPLVIANHWPLREDLVSLKFIPRFSLWCGTKLTHDWYKRFNACVVVSGHLHIRRTDWIDFTRFEEVSLGYPRQWRGCAERGLGVNELLREILPGPIDVPTVGGRLVPTQWRIYG